jgi:RHS repeat-associated protein
VFLNLPAFWTVYGSYAPPVTPVAWQGTLLENKTDKTGTLYRRNRVYDPVTGRFTQEDPIGFDGGLNLYGFAAGDPVNFSDPFGLCPDPKPKCKRVWLLGLSGAATAVYGGTLGAGVAWTGEGPAVWMQGGGTWGGGAGAGIEVGTSTSLETFRGRATGACVGAGAAVGGTVCTSVANTSEGWQLATTTVGVGVGTPVEVRGELAVTRVMTWADLKREVYAFLRKAEESMMGTATLR